MNNKIVSRCGRVSKSIVFTNFVCLYASRSVKLNVNHEIKCSSMFQMLEDSKSNM